MSSVYPMFQGIALGTGPFSVGTRLGSWPNGMLRIQYVPKGLLKVVRSDVLSSNFMAQYPFFVSRLLKNWVPANLCVISYNVGVS